VAVMVIGPLAPHSAIAAACDMHARWRRIEFRARVVSYCLSGRAGRHPIPRHPAARLRKPE
jgi:hypothetical protein